MENISQLINNLCQRKNYCHNFKKIRENDEFKLIKYDIKLLQKNLFLIFTQTCTQAYRYFQKQQQAHLYLFEILQINFNIFPNENIFFNYLLYQINAKDEKFDEININDINIELLKEIQLENQLPQEFNGKERLFSFNLDEKDDLEIMLLRNGSIECLYHVKNYLQDGEIIMNKNLCQIKSNISDCFQLHKFDQQTYIVQCKFNQNNTIIQILSQSQVFDEIIIPIQWQCQSDSILNKQILIIFNKQCQTTILYSIQIIDLSFTDFKQYDLTQLKGFSENNQYLIDLLFHTQSDIYIIYIKQIWILNMQNMQIELIYINSKFNIKKFQNYQKVSTSNTILEDTETNQLYKDKILLNISSMNFQNVFYFRNNIQVFQYTDKLLVKIQNYKKIFPINTTNLIQLGRLPYFLVQQYQQIILIQLILPKSVISYKNSDSILIIQFGFQVFISQVKLKIFDPNQPTQHFQKTTFFHEAFSLNDQICLPYDIYKRNHPLKINKITQNGIKLNFLNEYSIQMSPYLKRIISFNSIFILNKLNDEKLLLGLIQNNSLLKFIFFSNGEQIKQYKFQLRQNLIEIFFFQENQFLTIIYQNQIEIYQLNFDQIQKSVYQTEKKIIKAIKLTYVIIYLLEDCIKGQIQFTSQIFIFEQVQYSFDCKSSFQFYNNELYIDAHSILYYQPHGNTLITTLKEKIVQINNVLNNKLLIFTYHNDQYYAKLYAFQINELLFLYTLPTYNYTISFPFQYKLQQQILMIKVRKMDQGFFQLIYDLKNTAVESLIQINTIDEEDNYSFDFINEKEYFYSYQKQFYIQNLKQPCFSLQIEKEGYDFVEENQLIITIQSVITNENTDLEFHLIILNKNYTLQLLNKSQNIMIGNMINFENIFGNIEQVEIIGSEKIFIYQPLIFINYSAICNLYQLGICISEHSITRNIFDLNITILTFPYNCDQLTCYIGFNNENCNHAIYFKLNKSLIVNEFNFSQSSYIERQNYTIFNNTHNMEKFQQINDLQIAWMDNGTILFFFQYKPFLNQTLSNTFSNLNLNLFDGAQINDFTYFFLNVGVNIFELSVFNVTQLDDNGAVCNIFLQQKYELNNLFENQTILFGSSNFSSIQIYHVQKQNNQFQIKFIIILKNNLAVLMQIILDLNNQNEIAFEQLGIIRYENKAQFKKMLFIDLNYVILAFIQDTTSFINVFDISNILKHKNIDSIQKFKDNSYNFVERYNDSYFIIVEQLNSQEQRVHLITLDKFRIECQGECSKPSYLKLSNQVSQILIELNFLNEIEINKDDLQQYIVAFTFTCIVIKLFCKKEKINREKQISQP